MFNKLKKICLIVFLFSSFVYSENLTIKAKLSNTKINKSKENYLIISFIPENKVFLNFYPLLKIEIEEKSYLKFPKDKLKANDLDVEVFEKGNNKFINMKTPIKIPFELDKEYKKGKYKLVFSIEGFYTIQQEKITIKFFSKKEIYYYIK
jgi:hypothetical protein